MPSRIKTLDGKNIIIGNNANTKPIGLLDALKDEFGSNLDIDIPYDEQVVKFIIHHTGVMRYKDRGLKRNNIIKVIDACHFLSVERESYECIYRLLIANLKGCAEFMSQLDKKINTLKELDQNCDRYLALAGFIVDSIVSSGQESMNIIKIFSPKIQLLFTEALIDKRRWRHMTQQSWFYAYLAQ